MDLRLTELMSKISEILDKYETFEDKIKLMQSLGSSEVGGGDLSSNLSN